jgi:hypothetical protein
MSPVSKFSSYGKFKTMAMGNIKTEAPIIGTATDVGTGRAYNNGAASVTFTAPASNGSTSPITSYTVTSSPGGFTASGASSPITVTGLQSSTSYTFTVTATNAVGTSPASEASNSVTATTVPQAPTIGTATAGANSATVAYTAGATGGKAVSAYTATSSPGSATGTGASPITVSGLTNGTSYTFTVTATNANGTSTASTASNSISPFIPSWTFDYLVIAGGGSSDALWSTNPGQAGATPGAGAGGYRASTLTVTQGDAFTVTVGAGGSGGTSNGSNSVLSSITSLGGGSNVSNNTVTQQNSGGSGSGMTNAYSPSTIGAAGTAGQGNAGGGGNSNPGSSAYGGGGGAGGQGGNGTLASSPNVWTGGNGGGGVASSITGTSVGRAGGGGGSAWNGQNSGTIILGTGSSGGGPAGTTSAKNGTANTGGGAGGNSGHIAPFMGLTNPGLLTATGGSGVVIIAYPDSNPALTSISGGLSYSQPSRSGYRVYQFNSGTGTVTA